MTRGSPTRIVIITILLIVKNSYSIHSNGSYSINSNDSHLNEILISCGPDPTRPLARATTLNPQPFYYYYNYNYNYNYNYYYCYYYYYYRETPAPDVTSNKLIPLNFQCISSVLCVFSKLLRLECIHLMHPT